ncbi:MAG: 1-deoxy-D-xylulose-5-phosphate reductoisomerase [Eubacteriales bacterium]
MINISILGSTGSIGTQALEIADFFKDEINIVAITCNNNIDLLEKQIKKYNPKISVVMNKEKYEILNNRISTKTKLKYGMDGLKEAASIPEVDIVLTAVSGMIGLEPTISAIKSKKKIALANKETLVTGGSIIKKLMYENNVDILPVDSEHSAIFQCLQGNKTENIKKIILTASGGPFFGKDINFLKNVNVDEALNHPNWSMGKKITVDSSTLMNKGLEMIEAHWLFDVPYKDIDIVVHPESIIHSAVEYRDKSVIAQLGLPDMKLPIQYALFYPERKENNMESLNLFKLNQLNFYKPDIDTFKCLDLAYKAISIGGTMPTVLNVANEIAVDKFLKREISFLDIGDKIQTLMEQHSPFEVNTIDDILYVKTWVEKKFTELL